MVVGAALGVSRFRERACRPSSTPRGAALKLQSLRLNDVVLGGAALVCLGEALGRRRAWPDLTELHLHQAELLTQDVRVLIRAQAWRVPPLRVLDLPQSAPGR